MSSTSILHELILTYPHITLHIIQYLNYCDIPALLRVTSTLYHVLRGYSTDSDIPGHICLHVHNKENIYHNKLYGNIDLGHCTNVSVERLKDIMAHTVVLNSVQHLNVQFSTIEDNDLIVVIRRVEHTLHTLYLDGCHKVTDQTLVNILQQCPHLKLHHLSLYWMPQLTDTAVYSIAASSYVSTLTSLSLSGLKYITDDSIAALVYSASSLTSLDLTRCQALTDSSLIAIGSNIGKRLRTLIIYACGKFTDDGITQLAKQCPNLHTVDLTGSHLITDKSIAALCKYINVNMHVLILQWCIKLHDVSLYAISKYCTYIRVLNIHGCNEMTDAGIHSLTPSLQWLRSIDVNGCASITLRTYNVLKQMFPRLEHVAEL